MSQTPEDPKVRPERRSGPTAIVLSLLGLGGVLVAVVWAFVATWRSADRVSPASHLTAHGWAALVIAFVMVCVVGGGLVGLAFYSSRKGYDDRVQTREE